MEAANDALLFRVRCAAVRFVRDRLPAIVATVVVDYAWSALAPPGGVAVDNRFRPEYYYYPSGSLDDAMATRTVSDPEATARVWADSEAWATAHMQPSMRTTEYRGTAWIPGEAAGAGILFGDVWAAWDRICAAPWYREWLCRGPRSVGPGGGGRPGGGRGGGPG